MRHSLHAAVLLLALSACGSVSDGGNTSEEDPTAADAAVGPAELDVCQWMPKEVADLILGGAAHDPLPTGNSEREGGCSWSGADTFDRLAVHVLLTGTSAELFSQLCEASKLPMIDARGIGLAACGRDEFHPALLIQLDATTTTLTLTSDIGTLDQCFEVLREVAARLPPP